MSLNSTVRSIERKNRLNKIKSLGKLWQIRGALMRHLLMRNNKPYEQALSRFQRQGDIWLVSQGEYLHWWQAREQAPFTVRVADGHCYPELSLQNGVIEHYPGHFLPAEAVACEATVVTGEIFIGIDPELAHRDILVELLKREGILNYKLSGNEAVVLNSTNVGPLLTLIESKLRERGRYFEEDVAQLREIIVQALAARGLPLLRVWYHPQLNGTVMRAVFSPRYDVDRAITNLKLIRELELRYGVSSTLYLRAFCPFYGEPAIKHLASQPWCSEIGLHGEFVTTAQRTGDQFSAAVAEKTRLEQWVGRPVLGVCMHGGELTSNTTPETSAVVEAAGLLYDTTQNMHYFFPFRKLVDGRLSRSYTLVHPTGDIKMPITRHYNQRFYQTIVTTMDEIYQQNGVFVLMLHPVYFGFGRYLMNPANWKYLLRFARSYFARSLGRSE